MSSSSSNNVAAVASSADAHAVAANAGAQAAAAATLNGMQGPSNHTDSAYDVKSQAQLLKFWQERNQQVKDIDIKTEDFKAHELPLARIKRIMKLDEDVRMISAEAPILFAAAADIFVHELSFVPRQIGSPK